MRPVLRERERERELLAGGKDRHVNVREDILKKVHLLKQNLFITYHKKRKLIFLRTRRDQYHIKLKKITVF
jgi:hypothetical protein